MQVGFTIQSQQNSINPDALKNVLAMTGKDTVIRWMEDASRYYPSTTQPDFADLDTTIAACGKAGLPVCLPIHNLASSFVKAGTGHCSGKNFIDPIAIGTLAGVLATRYKGQAVWYESFNEGVGDGNPDCDLTYTADPSGAVAVMKAVYQAVKAVDSSILVGGPAFLKIEQGIPYLEEWLSNLLGNNAGASMDYMSLHYYPGTNAALPALHDLWQAFQTVATKYGYPHLKLRITEYGWPLGHVTPQQQHDLTMAVLSEVEQSGGFIEAAYYYTAAENDGYSPYDKSQQYPLYAGFQQFVQQQQKGGSMTTLANYPLISQQTKISGDGSSPNAQQDCVPTSILSGVMWLKGIPQMDSTWNPDKLLDMAYPEGYTGGTSAEKYVEACKSLGINLTPINGDPASLITAIHQQIEAQHPVIFTIPDPYVPASYGWSHVLAAYGESNGQITALDPWPGKPTTKSDAEWQSLLQFNRIWVLEKLVMSTVPAKWQDDGKTLTAPNGVQVVLGFRDYVLSHNWDASNFPLGPQYYTKQLEDSQPTLGDGDQIVFRDGMLGYPHNPTGAFAHMKDTVIEEWIGQELLAVRALAVKYYTAIQTLNQEITQLQAQQGSPQDHTLLLQVKQLVAPIS